jgi:hypothetical protein
MEEYRKYTLGFGLSYILAISEDGNWLKEKLTFTLHDFWKFDDNKWGSRIKGGSITRVPVYEESHIKKSK